MKELFRLSQKYIYLLTITALPFIAYSVIADLYFFNHSFKLSYLFTKTLFALFPIFIAFQYSKNPSALKTFTVGLSYALFSIFYTYTISISYIVGAILLTLVYSTLIPIRVRDYLILQTILLSGMVFSIIYGHGVYTLAGRSEHLRLEYVTNFLIIAIFSILVYLILTYPRLKKMKEELTFSKIGKTSAFLLHEISKPVSRINADSPTIEKDLEQIRDVLTIAHELAGNNTTKDIFPIKLAPFIREILKDYQSFIDFYQIDVHVSIKEDCIVNVEPRYFKIILNNAIKNSIEAVKDFDLNSNVNKRIEICYSDSYIRITNPYKKTLPLKIIFKPTKTTKTGNMGLGLYISELIAKNLNWKIKIKIEKDLFVLDLHL